MEIYLSSYRQGDQSEMLLDSKVQDKRVAAIQNAQDCRMDPGKRKSVPGREIEDLIGLGLEPVGLDLSKFFGRQDELREEVSRLGYCSSLEDDNKISEGAPHEL